MTRRLSQAPAAAWLRRLGRRIMGRTPEALDLPFRCFADRRAHVWFGHYDLCPLDQGQNLLLAHRAAMPNRPPGPGDLVEVGVFRFREPGRPFQPLGHSSAWCWRLGSRLMWLPPGPGQAGQCFAYNVHQGGEPGAVLARASDGAELARLPLPIYCLSPDGARALCLNLARLGRLSPGRGHALAEDKSAGQSAPADDGLFCLDLASGRAELLFSLAELAAFQATPGMQGARHYLAHAAYSPGGTRLLICQQWLGQGQWQGRLLVARRDGSNLRPLAATAPQWRAAWLDEETVYLCQGRPDGGVDLRLFPLPGPEAAPMATVPPGPGAGLVAGSGPDQWLDRRLLFFPSGQERPATLARFYDPPSYRGQVACELNPRLSPDGRRVCLDAVYGGRRALWVLDLL